MFLQVDLGAVRPVTRFVVKHASAGGENEESDTRDFNIQLSNDGKIFTTVASSTGAGFVDERTEDRELVYFDGRREARLLFGDGKLEGRDINRLLDFEEDRTVFAGIFQYFYLRLAIFFGCLGIFMYLFRGEMANRTLHFWFLAPARRDVLLAGKYAAGLIASTVIFGGGALLTLAAMIWPHDAVEVQAFWNAGGMGQVFWYAAAAALGCVGYGSVFLAVGLYVRNPIIPAAVLLAWEGANGIFPHVLQKNEHPLLPAVSVSRASADGRRRPDADQAAGRARRSRLASGGDSRVAAADRVRPVDRQPRRAAHADLLWRQRNVISAVPLVGRQAAVGAIQRATGPRYWSSQESTSFTTSDRLTITSWAAS